MEQTALEPPHGQYQIWVDWKQEIVSFHQVLGFEVLPFPTWESQQANVRILLTAGFRFQ